jgi:hypothetical protein
MRTINIVYTIGAEFSNNEHAIMDLALGLHCVTKKIFQSGQQGANVLR